MFKTLTVFFFFFQQKHNRKKNSSIVESKLNQNETLALHAPIHRFNIQSRKPNTIVAVIVAHAIYNLWWLNNIIVYFLNNSGQNTNQVKRIVPKYKWKFISFGGLGVWSKRCFIKSSYYVTCMTYNEQWFFLFLCSTFIFWCMLLLLCTTGQIECNNDNNNINFTEVETWNNNNNKRTIERIYSCVYYTCTTKAHMYIVTCTNTINLTTIIFVVNSISRYKRSNRRREN